MEHGQPQMNAYQSPPVSYDILAPPVWNGVPGQLLPFSASSSIIGYNYGISGDSTQVLQYLLRPGESVQSEAGAMVFKGADVEMNTRFGGMRILAGESFGVLVN